MKSIRLLLIFATVPIHKELDDDDEIKDEGQHYGSDEDIIICCFHKKCK